PEVRPRRKPGKPRRANRSRSPASFSRPRIPSVQRETPRDQAASDPAPSTSVEQDRQQQNRVLVAVHGMLGPPRDASIAPPRARSPSRAGRPHPALQAVQDHRPGDAVRRDLGALADDQPGRLEGGAFGTEGWRKLGAIPFAYGTVDHVAEPA